MCLYTRDMYTDSPKVVRSKIAKEDLVVIKEMNIIDYQKGIYGSYYQDFTYQKGYHYSNDNFPKRTSKYELNGEGLHSFTPGRYGNSIGDTIRPHTSEYLAIIECVIPKGTRYYVGRYNDILSQQLIIIGQPSPKRNKEILKLNQVF